MRQMVARDVMTPDIQTVDEAMTVRELATFLIDHEITGAVVNGEDGRPIGVVSLTDIASATAIGGESLEENTPQTSFYSNGWPAVLDDSDVQGVHVSEDDLTTGEIMTPEIFSVAAHTPVSEVAQLLCDSHLHRVLVTENDELVGIITTSDLLGLLVDEPS